MNTAYRVRTGDSERGIALLMTVFVIAIGTVLIFELGRMARYDQRSARSFAERIQGNYIIRSGFNVGQVILSIPKIENPKEDWFGDIWSQIGYARDLPIEGLPGNPRIQIVDESSKFNINWLGERGPKGDRWRERFISLFNQLGFVQENFPSGDNRAIGGAAFDDLTQVAAISDWIDEDRSNFQSQALTAKGFESNAPPGYFFNRNLKNINELLLVPGMTRERLGRLIPYVRVDDPSGDSQRININTARYETLVALGYPASIASEITLGQRQAPITTERLKELNQIDTTLNSITTVRAQEYSIIVRVTLPNSVRWGRAFVSSLNAGAGPRSASLNSLEIY